MQNTISFKSKFGWISATEINNKISRIHFLKETCFDFSAKTINTFYQMRPRTLGARDEDNFDKKLLPNV